MVLNTIKFLPYRIISYSQCSILYFNSIRTLRPIWITTKSWVIHSTIFHLFFRIRIDFHFLICNQTIQPLIILLWMPAKRMPINCQSSSLCRLYKLRHCTEIHTSIICHNGCILHSITCYYLIKISNSHATNHFSFQKIISCDPCSQLKVRMSTTVYICLQCVIRIKILILGYALWFLRLKIDEFIVGTRGWNKQQSQTEIFIYAIFHNHISKI